MPLPRLPLPRRGTTLRPTMSPPSDQPASPPPNPAKKASSGQTFQSPRGTRDFYPIEMARRLWLEDKWRRTAIRHGFDEIDGPTFEHLDLYTVKSGEGIVSELFSFTRAGGETPFALRPEFTPTLARMAAAKANALPKPIKWFSIGPYFRAERPQRGRLREFLQWNVDVLGDPSPEADAEVIACCVESMQSVGLSSADVRILVNDRRVVDDRMDYWGVPASERNELLSMLDRAEKMDKEEFFAAISKFTLNFNRFLEFVQSAGRPLPLAKTEFSTGESLNQAFPKVHASHERISCLKSALADLGVIDWCFWEAGIVRGLAYYTGTVFEVHEAAGAERAIAGGGRYDNLVELFGGPPTPAVGFAMGDVVISLVLQDKGLMPSDDAIARDLGLQPDAFVFAANDEADQKALRPLLAALRRAGLHARRSYKTTRNVGKLLQDADKCAARFAVILESPTSATVKDLGAATRSDGEPVSGADIATLASAIIARIPAR